MVEYYAMISQDTLFFLSRKETTIGNSLGYIHPRWCYVFGETYSYVIFFINKYSVFFRKKKSQMISFNQFITPTPSTINVESLKKLNLA